MEKDSGTSSNVFAECWDIHRTTHWRRVNTAAATKKQPRASRISGDVRRKVIEIDQRYRSSWDVRSIAYVTGISHSSVAKILREYRGPRPEPAKRSHNRRTMFLLRDVMWSSDFKVLYDGRSLLKTLDEASRHILGWNAYDTETGEEVAEHGEDIIYRMGRYPLLWKYDHGSPFTGKKFQEFLDYYGIIPYPIPPRAPWANGRTERDNREVQNWLIAAEKQGLAGKELDADLDEGMFMLRFIKPRAMLSYKTTAGVYFNTDGVASVDRKLFKAEIDDTKRMLGNYGSERIHRRAVRIVMQKWGFYKEWEEFPKNAKLIEAETVNKSEALNVAL